MPGFAAERVIRRRGGDSVRADRRVEPAIAPRLRETALVLDVVLVFRLELLDRRHHRAGRGVAERTERLAALLEVDHRSDVAGDVVEIVRVALPAPSPLDAVENRFHPVRSFAARRALAARLM